MKSFKVFRGLACIMSLLTATGVGLTMSMFAQEGHVNRFLGTPTSELRPIEGAENLEKPIRYASDYAADINAFTPEEWAAKCAAADEFIEREAEEGSVLLRNKNNALPLTDSDIKSVSLFGRATVDPYFKSQSGGGEGGAGEAIDYLEALQEQGFSYNQKLVDAYNGDTTPKTNFEHLGESPVGVYTNEVKNSFKNTEVAIVMLSRMAGESHDLITYYTDDDGQTIGMLELSKNERDMLSLVKEYKDNGTFKKVIVLLNTSNALEVNWLDDYGVDACMWIGGPGRGCGFRGVADLLTGDANPSGRLTDTYAASSMSSPAMQNFGSFQYTNGGAYVVYSESIYVGYKYYETRYEDTILNQGNASANVGVWESKGGWNYADEMVYPFGYGLSYTTFEQTLDKVEENKSTRKLTATVTVKNVGDVAGKSVVELYAQTPYGDYEKENLVEKSAIQLVGFDKTGVIEPGEEETLTIEVDKYFLASYDYKNAKTYIMSEGEYYLALGDDAHDALNNVLAKKGASGMVDPEGNAVSGDANKVHTWYEKFDSDAFSRSKTGKEVTNQFDNCDVNYWIDDAVTYLSRQDWQGTYPKMLRGEDALTKNAGMVEPMYEKPEDAPSVFDVVTEKDAGLKFADMWGVEWESEYWTQFMDQLSIDDLISLTQDVRGLEALESVAFPETIGADGPDGLPGENAYVTFNLACASWSTDMLAERGKFLGEDCLYQKVQFFWGPGFNLHRTPYAGRNFEYVSEDGFLGYELGAANIAAMQAKGVNVGLKHFFANDQETHRGGINTFATEQAFRENVLRMFEGCFVKGKSQALMLGNNNIGITNMGQYTPLLLDVLRGEWGFRGVVITDACGSSEGNVRTIESIACGTNMFCFSDREVRSRRLKQAIVGQDDGNLLLLLKERMKETLYAYAHTNVMNGLTSAYEVVPVTPWWKIAVVSIDAVLGGLTLIMVVGFLATSNKKEKVVTKKGGKR